MSEQIKKAFSEYKGLFKERKDEMRKYLLKHYLRDFQRRKLIEVKKIDARDRIEKSGFFTNLTSWKNIYQNITVSTCLMEGNEKKRFDYKFIFTKEKLDEATIERIEEGLKECNSLKLNFKFEEALRKIDEIADSISRKDDEFFNDLLSKRRDEIVKSQEEYEKQMEKLKELEDDIKINQKYNNLDELVKNCEEIIPLTTALRNRPLKKKYSDLLEKTQKKIEDKKALEAKMANEEKERLEKERQLERQKALEEKEARKEQRELEKQKEQEEKERLRKQKELEKQKEKKKKRKEGKERDKQKKLENLAQYEEQVRKKREQGDYDGAIRACKKVIAISKQLNDEDNIKKYKAILLELENEAETAEKEKIKELPALKKIKITCLIAGLLMIASAIANIMLLVDSIYSNIIIPFLGETPGTFFIFLYGNACFTILGGIMVILGLIEIHALTIKFGIPIGFMGTVMYFIVAIWAAYLCGPLILQIITFGLIFFIMGILGIFLAYNALKHVEQMEESMNNEKDAGEFGKNTFKSNKGIPLMTLTDMTLAINKKLIRLGIKDVQSLCEVEPKDLANKINVSEQKISEWIKEGKNLIA